MRPPNLLFLITDQQRADTTEPHTACPMPHLTALARRGTRFNRCTTVNPICSPTRASLFTGVLPHTHGMVDCTHAVPAYRARFNTDLPVWPSLLRQAGYRTGYFGKWHVERSNRLENFGFDEYDVEAYHQVLGLVERHETMHPQRRVSHPGYRDFLMYGVVDSPVEETPEHRLYSRGIEFVRRAARQPDRPWALVLSTEAPHDPYVVPREYFERITPADIPRPPSFYDDLSGRPAIYRRIQQVWQDVEWADFAAATACYYAFCALVDDQIGRIIQSLHESDQLENTLIVFTSDHGDYMGAHRLLLKGIPAFDDVYRVPLILSGPGIPAGQEISRRVSLLDLPRTLTQLTAGKDFACQGRSLAPLLAESPPADWADETFAECHGQRFHYTQRIVWRDEFKYVFNGFDEDELYNLADDPH
ncbi:MAG: DUF229 domain-containing protein, partial [Chloroflexi bacterium]